MDFVLPKIRVRWTIPKNESVSTIDSGLFALNTLSSQKNPNLVKLLEKYKAPKEQFPPTVETAFRRAAALGRQEDVELLYVWVQDINTQDDNPNTKRTALHWAALKGHSGIVEYLKNKGAKADIEDADKKTASDYLMQQTSERKGPRP